VQPRRLLARLQVGLLIVGLALGLFVSRVLVEALPAGHGLPLTLGLAALLGATGVGLVLFLSARGLALAPLCTLLVYCVWPRPEPGVAAAVAGVAFAGVAILHFWSCGGLRRLHPALIGWAELVPAVAGLGLYLRTLAPTVLPADSGEFQLVARVLGIAHPPGYPLYTLLGRLSALLPIGDAAFRVNLLSAVTSACTVAVVSRCVRSMTRSVLAGWFAAVSLLAAPTFWAQGTTANVRSLTALFTALQVYTLLRYSPSREQSDLVVFALVLGLGLSHHSSLLPFVLAYLVFLLVSDPTLARQPRAWRRPALAFAAGFLPLLYLPLRSLMGAPFDPQPIRSVAGFVEHVLALGFRGDMFYFVELPQLAARMQVLSDIAAFQFGPTWWLVPLVGFATLAVQRPRVLVLLGGMLGMNALLALTYRAPQTVEYLMPSYVILAVVAGYGLWEGLERLRRVAKGGAAVAAMAMAAAFLWPAGTLAKNYPSFIQLHQDHSARSNAERLLSEAPQGARVLANWHYATPLWYLQMVEGRRPDVDVVYVYPQGAQSIGQTWAERVVESVALRPTIVTNRYYELQGLPYALRPMADGWLVTADALTEVPAGTSPLEADFDNRIRLVGFDCDPSSASPSETVTVRLYWTPTTVLERDYSFFVHLVDGGGVPVAQGDFTHAAATYEPGEIVVDEYRLSLLSTVEPGSYRLVAGVYITLPEGGWQRLTLADGADTVALGAVGVLSLREPPVTAHRLYRHFDNGYTLLGVDFDHSIEGQVRVYLHWRADRSMPAQCRVLVFARGELRSSTELPSLAQGSYFSSAHDMPSGMQDLAIELQAASDGAPVRWLGPWNLAMGRRLGLSEPVPDERYISLGGEILLLGVEHRSEAARGGLLDVALGLAGQRPLAHDYTVSVKLLGAQGGWQVQDDGTPAWGAVPTLKWLWGTRIHDVHRLDLAGAGDGLAHLKVTVYDAFTLQPLSVLDDRLARLGQGTEITVGSLVVRSPEGDLGR